MVLFRAALHTRQAVLADHSLTTLVPDSRRRCHQTVTGAAIEYLLVWTNSNTYSMRAYQILFLCTHNSARSILGEALASTHPSGRFVGHSAGSTPGGKVNPFAQELALAMGYPADKLRSKSWDEFAAGDTTTMDFVITVCDNAAGEVCPVWPGKPATAHWGFPDPSQAEGDDEHKRRAFREVMLGLQRRIDLLAALPLEKLDQMSLQSELRKLGKP